MGRERSRREDGLDLEELIDRETTSIVNARYIVKIPRKRERKGRRMAEEKKVEQKIEKRDGLSVEELEEQTGEQLPDREEMSLVDANIAIPVNAAVAANVLSDDAVAYADATQDAAIDQSNQ